MRLKENIPLLFEVGPDWEWDDNLKHWFCQLDGMKVFMWCDCLNPPEPEKKTKKLSKSLDGTKKVLWDGICTKIPGGPEPSERPGPILFWIRKKLKQKERR